MAKRRRKQKVETQDVEIQTQGAEIRTQEVETEEAVPYGQVAPDADLPETYKRFRAYLPCPKCRRFLTTIGRTQAVVCQAINRASEGERAYLECRECDHRYSLPVEDDR